MHCSILLKIDIWTVQQVFCNSGCGRQRWNSKHQSTSFY